MHQSLIQRQHFQFKRPCWKSTTPPSHRTILYVRICTAQALRHSASKKKTFWCPFICQKQISCNFLQNFSSNPETHQKFDSLFVWSLSLSSTQGKYPKALFFQFFNRVGRTIKSVSPNHKTAIETDCLVVSCCLCGQNEPGLHYRFCQCRGSCNLTSPCTCLLPQNHAPLCPESPARTRTRKLCIFIHSRESWSGADVGQ